MMKNAKKQQRKYSSEVFNSNQTDRVAALSQKVFGRFPLRVAFPGGPSRMAFIADMGSEKYVFTRRNNVADAKFEAIVLKNLAEGGLVPRLRARVDDWVVQEQLVGTRLPVVLDDAGSEKEKKNLVARSLDSLATIQEQAHERGLQHRALKIGVAKNWLWNRTGAAKRISTNLGIEEPTIDRKALVKAMNVKRDEFVKWDARPGNAMVTQNAIVWFDWEDCGRSKALDDLAYVLCDEWLQLEPTSEQELFKQYFERFNRSMSPIEGQRYIRLFGVTHMLLRLRMATKLYHRKNEWWDRNYCLSADKVGVTNRETKNLVTKIRRWSDGVEEWGNLPSWLDTIAAHYDL